MSQKEKLAPRVGEIRPSQLMFTYGVGAVVDLPKLSVIVNGLDDWPVKPQYMQPVIEDRLLVAVRYKLPSVKRLMSLPISPDAGSADPHEPAFSTGVPVATFPRWMLCPQCRLLAPLEDGLFELDTRWLHRPDRIVYQHVNCIKSKSPPEVVPARFMIACESGHLDDFPWRDFVHRDEPCKQASPLHLIEYGASGEARDLEVRCGCGARRRLSEAFVPENAPPCTGRRPHLRDYDPDGCELRARTILLGASNTWFPVVFSTVAIPVESERLAQLVNDNWAKLQAVTSPEVLQAFKSIGQIGGEFDEYNDQEVWEAIERRRARDAGDAPPQGMPDLKAPEWEILTHYNPTKNNDDFRLRPVELPANSPYHDVIEQVMLVERLREVRAMIGFTRIDAAGELTDPERGEEIEPVRLAREDPSWVPANEVRGEGIFIQFKEEAIRAWQRQGMVTERGVAFFTVHKKWRATRRIEDLEAGFPGMRYILLHSFSHALMRQLALECGYASASIRERIYARPLGKGGPMAGVLIYTSAPDSEGTLGGLVSLGKPETLAMLITQALETARLCASDPLCAERPPSQDGRTLHAAACHACSFAPETSCERGNKYLDRSTLVPTVARDDLAFFK